MYQHERLETCLFRAFECHAQHMLPQSTVTLCIIYACVMLCLVFIVSGIGCYLVHQLRLPERNNHVKAFEG